MEYLPVFWNNCRNKCINKTKHFKDKNKTNEQCERWSCKRCLYGFLSEMPCYRSWECFGHFLGIFRKFFRVFLVFVPIVMNYLNCFCMLFNISIVITNKIHTLSGHSQCSAIHNLHWVQNMWYILQHSKMRHVNVPIKHFFFWN